MGVDLVALQARLQSERARMASEIESNFTGVATTSTGKPNPFSFSQSTSSSLGPTRPHSNAFTSQHRPVTLGLGAELPAGGNAASPEASMNNKRLKGILSDKRKDTGKSAVKNAHFKEMEESEEDSRHSAPVRNRANRHALERSISGGKRLRMDDPFAMGKRQRKVQNIDLLSDGKQDDQTLRNSQKPTKETEMSQLSKKARKKLQKRGLKEVHRSDGVDRNESSTTDQNIVLNGQKTDDVSQEARLAVPQGSQNRCQKQVNDPVIKGSGAQPGRLTNHQQAMQAKLAGARFRQINESLYTTHSTAAMEMAKAEPHTLIEYHRGFREQVKNWPTVPVQQIFELLADAQRQMMHQPTSSMPSASKDRASDRKRKGKETESPLANGSGSGRRAIGALIVDLGAGEGFLAKWLTIKAGLNVRVLSYDLCDSEDGWVVGADIARVGGLPLPGKAALPFSLETVTYKNGEERKQEANRDITRDGQDEHHLDEADRARMVDVAVFCLSLMATNWVDKIREASRILRPHGELFIAEVTSRFHDIDGFVSLVESLGFTLQSKNTDNTHFILLTFVKLPASRWRSPYESEAQLQDLVELGQNLLKPCVYKRR